MNSNLNIYKLMNIRKISLPYLYILGYTIFYISLFLPSVSGSSNTVIFGTSFGSRCYIGYEALLASLIIPFVSFMKSGSAALDIHWFFLVSISICNLVVITSPFVYFKSTNKYLVKAYSALMGYAAFAVWMILLMNQSYSKICIGYYLWCIAIDLILSTILVRFYKLII